MFELWYVVCQVLISEFHILHRKTSKHILLQGTLNRILALPLSMAERGSINHPSGLPETELVSGEGKLLLEYVQEFAEISSIFVEVEKDTGLPYIGSFSFSFYSIEQPRSSFWTMKLNLCRIWKRWSGGSA